MQAILLSAQANILAKLGPIGKLNVIMEFREHSSHVWAHNIAQAHKLASMHSMYLCAQAHISAE